LKFANVLVILKKLTDALIVRQSLDLGQEASITKDMQSKYSIWHFKDWPSKWLTPFWAVTSSPPRNHLRHLVVRVALEKKRFLFSSTKLNAFC